MIVIILITVIAILVVVMIMFRALRMDKPMERKVGAGFLWSQLGAM